MAKMDWEYVTARLIDSGYLEEHINHMVEKLRQIDELRQKKNAIILAHYYQILPIQLVADICGDSLALAMARDAISDKDLVVSSTVNFMAEMIKLLNPDKKVVIPNSAASCSIAEGINGSTLKKIKQYYPDSALIGYINTTADVKAHLDYCCTSANAVKIVESAVGNPIIVLPDEYFGRNIYKKLDRNINYFVYRGIREESIVLLDMNKNEKEIILPLDGAKAPTLDRGICTVHDSFSESHIEYYKKKENVELVLAHPEVKPEVAAKADIVGGTNKMISCVADSNAKNILYLTECDLAAPLISAYPDRNFITPCVLCPYMKKNSVDLLLYALTSEESEVNVPEHILEPAQGAITRMLEIT